MSNSRPEALQRKPNLTLKYGYNFATNGTSSERFRQYPGWNLICCSALFFKDARKKNGDEYEPGSLTCLQRSIQRYLNTHGTGSQANLIQGGEFKLSREVLSAKRKQLVVERGKGNRPQASREVTAVEEDKLFAEGEFGEHNLVAQQRTVWRLLALHFGFRARDESRRLQWGDVSLETDPDTGNEMLVWKAERGSKTRQGQDKASGHRAFYPTAQATDNERCPVKYYQLFRSHRPIEMNQPEAPFYLAIKHQRKATNAVWYKKSPLGRKKRNVRSSFFASLWPEPKRNSTNIFPIRTSR